MPPKTGYKKRYAKKTYKRFKKFTRKPFGNTNPSNDTSLVILNKSRRQIIKVSRTWSNALLQQAGSGSYNDYKLLSVTLADLPNYTEFSSLFSKYRITQLDLTIRATDINNDEDLQPVAYVWRNYNSALSVVTSTVVNQIPNVYTKQLSSDNRVLNLSMKPYVLGTVFSGGYEHAYDKWIDIAYVSVPYYGFGMFFEALTQASAGLQNIDYDLVCHVELMSEK